MKKYDIYFSCSFRNKHIIDSLVNELRNEGISVYSPIEINKDGWSDTLICACNLNAIDDSTIFLAIVDYFGIDFGFEIGYARGLQKSIIAYSSTGCWSKSAMVIGCINKLIFNKDLLIKKIIETLGEIKNG